MKKLLLNSIEYVLNLCLESVKPSIFRHTHTVYTKHTKQKQKKYFFASARLALTYNLQSQYCNCFICDSIHVVALLIPSKQNLRAILSLQYIYIFI